MFEAGGSGEHAEALPGPGLAALAAAVVPADARTSELFSLLVVFERLTSWAQAGSLAVLAEIMRRDTAPRPDDAPEPPRRGQPRIGEFSISEVACALGLTEYSAGIRVELAQALASRHPWVLDALADGRLDLPRARVLIEETRHLDDERAAEITIDLLGAAERLTTTRLRQRVRAAALRSDPEGRRSREAVDGREVWLVPGPDGMTTLGATLPDADAARAYALVDQAARALVSADRDCGCGPVRSLPQARADALVDLVIGDRLGDSTKGDGALPRRPAMPKTLVTVTVPLASLLGEAHDGTPGHLGWIGSVLPESARQIALGALREMSGGRVGVRWIAVDDGGRAVAVTGTAYQASPLLRAAVDARDVRCRFPSCARPAERCDCDHNEPFPRGPTAEANLCCLCRRHHRLKTHGGWRVVRGRNGTLRWSSPRGATYVTHPGLWHDPIDPPWWVDPERPAPEDPAEAWSDAEYEASVARICAEAAEADGVGTVAESGGPDLPRTWRAPLLSDWQGEPANVGGGSTDGDGGGSTDAHRGGPTNGDGEPAERNGEPDYGSGCRAS